MDMGLAMCSFLLDLVIPIPGADHGRKGTVRLMYKSNACLKIDDPIGGQLFIGEGVILPIPPDVVKGLLLHNFLRLLRGDPTVRFPLS